MPMTLEALEKINLGSYLVRIVFHEDGNFYREDDENKKKPIKVSPIKNGLNILRLYEHQYEYGPTYKEELNHNLAEKITQLTNKEKVLQGNIAVRMNQTRLSDHIVYEFYRIKE